MALQGDMRDFTLTQLLNLINLAQKTGTLVVENPSEVIAVSFRDGKLAYARDGNAEDNLVDILHRYNKLDADQHKLLNEQLGKLEEKALGLALINANYIEQSEILSCLQANFTEIVKQLSGWAEGLFHFESGRFPPKEKITVRLDLENLILDGLHRQQVIDQLQDEIPNLDMALKLLERPGVKIRNMNLNAQEWRVITYINSRNTLRQIASSTGLSDLEIRQVAYSLLQAGVVEIIKPEDHRQTFPILNHAPRPAPAGLPTQKSLINRLISRIRAM